MRDPYLYDDVDVLRNRANIKDSDMLRKAEADITNLAMSAIYERDYNKFDIDTLRDIHRSIFGQIFDWAGEFRTIQMVKYEEVLGGDTVRYAYPKDIKKELTTTMKEIGKLKRTGDNDHDVVFRLVRIIAAIWHTHPFREGNGRAQRLFIEYLAGVAGYGIDFSEITPQEMIVASAEAFNCQYDKMENIFQKSVYQLTEDTQERYIQLFFPLQVP